MAQGRHNNNFDLLRLLAAFQVLFLHVFADLGLPIPGGAVLAIFPGVPIFFVISGFLVSESYERTSLPTYLLNRGLRIFPGLWACLAVSMVIAAVWGGVSFAGAGAWIAAQATVVQFYNPPFLRGFGVGTLNGSLWTIPVELQFYLALPFIYWLFKTNRVLIGAILAGVAINLAYQAWGLEDRSFAQKLVGETLPVYLYMFLLGVALQKNRWFIERFLVGKLPQWLGVYLVFALAAEVAGFPSGGNFLNPASAIVLALVVVSAAFARTIPLKHDVSYGLYLYHMPVVNAFYEQGRHAVTDALLCIVITAALAWASWLLIERPALRLKRRMFAPPLAAPSR